MWLIDYAQTVKGDLITVVSESFPHLEDGAIRDFKSIMMAQSYWNEDRWHGTKHEYTFETGSVIEFTSIDTYGKAHGPRRDVLFINEANNLDYKIADQLITRTRKIVWMDWNPSEEFWFYTEMLPNREDIDFITLTYLDNEALDETSKSEIEAHRNNKEWWTVYGEGKLGVITSRIYRNWQIVDEVPFEAKLMRTGLDFGYSNDPSAVVDVYEYNGGLILDEILYAKGQSNQQIGAVLTSKEPKALVIADSAEPKSIDEIHGYGASILAAEKGKDSVVNGIQVVQNEKISVTKRSINIIKEYRNYLWITDKNGHVVNEPEHTFSHSMDAIRYAIVSFKTRPSTNAIVNKPTVFRYRQAGYQPGDYGAPRS